MENILTVLNVAFFNVIVPVLILSFMVFVHELGHYLTARWIKAEIKEFAVGMGPKLWGYKSKKTNILYAIRAVPIGGALTLVGEDENSESENAFFRKPVWQRFIMIISGSVMNLLLGFIIMSVIVSGARGYYSTTINRFDAGSTSNAQEGLIEGDRILKINRKNINIYNDLIYALIREGGEAVNVTVLRDGQRHVITDVKFPTFTDSGMTGGLPDFRAEIEIKTAGTVIRQAFYQSIGTIDMVWMSFFDLITGKYGVEQISGPVGITQVIGNSAREVAEDRERSSGFLFMLAVITMNLGIVNLLPLPALDGGRIVFLFIELVRRKPLKPEYEGYVHLAGFALLILLIIVVTYRDIMQLIVN
ncbi:MAG: M50 family metallopeptidase [Oscillospiraceae bacterium]|nr:M50 family metallopeptidase [Oscillospiraceae bacterium]